MIFRLWYLLLLNALVVLLLIPVSQVRMTYPKGNPILQYALVQCCRSASRNTTTIFLIYCYLCMPVAHWPWLSIGEFYGWFAKTDRQKSNTECYVWISEYWYAKSDRQIGLVDAMFGLGSIDLLNRDVFLCFVFN